MVQLPRLAVCVTAPAVHHTGLPQPKASPKRNGVAEVAPAQHAFRAVPISVAPGAAVTDFSDTDAGVQLVGAGAAQTLRVIMNCETLASQYPADCAVCLVLMAPAASSARCCKAAAAPSAASSSGQMVSGSSSGGGAATRQSVSKLYRTSSGSAY